MKVFILIIVLIAFCKSGINQNFYGGIKAGVNVSQVDGDGFGGFKKIAPFGGVYVRNTFGNNLGGMLEIKYKHKGAKEVRRNEAGVVFFKHEIRLDYIEIPVTLNFKIEKLLIPSLINYEFRNDMFLEFGISYSYLISAKEVEGDGSTYTPLARPYNSYDLLTHQGFTYRMSDNFLISFRHYWTFFFFMFPIREHPGGSKYWFDHGEYNRNAELSVMYEF